MLTISRSVVAQALGLALVLGAGPAWAGEGPQERPPGVGPNGEVNGLSAKFIDVNGVRTRYYEYGQGDPIVLLHGGGPGGLGSVSNANNWSLNIRGLAERFHVFAPDRIGSGLTDIPKDVSQLSREGNADHIYEFIKAVGLTRVDLIGHSGGGGVAVELTLRHPEVVRTLVVVSNSGDSVTPLTLSGINNISRIREWACQSLEGTDAKLAGRCWYNVMSGNPAVWDDAFFDASWEMSNRPRQREIQAYLQTGAGAARPRRERPSWSAVMEHARNNPMHVPILYVQGANDTSGHDPVDEIAGMQRGLGYYRILSTYSDRALMIVYHTGGHFPYRQFPERFNYDVAQFIEYWKTAAEGR